MRMGALGVNSVNLVVQWTASVWRHIMKVKVIAPLGSDFSVLDSKSWIELPEGCTVRSVLKIIKCNPLKAKLLLVSVNGERTKLDRVLKDGDVVGFFSPISGG